MPYRTRIEPEPELPDPAVEAYARRVAGDRRRGGYRFAKVACLVALAVGTLVTGVKFALHTVPERRMMERWREALTCFDHGHEGLRTRLRARQLAAIGDDSDWPSRCSRPFHALALAAAAAGHHAVEESADHLAHVAAHADLESDDLVVPTSTFFNDGAHIGLRALAPVRETPRYTPHLSDLLASAGWTAPPYWPAQIDYDRCRLDDDGRHLTCGIPLGERVLPHLNDSLVIRDLPDGGLGLQTCDDGLAPRPYTWPPCPIEPLEIGRPPIVSVARLGTKLVVVWAPMTAVGGVRVRIGDRGMLASGKARVVLDDRIPGDTISSVRIASLIAIEHGDAALILLKTAEGRSLALRLDASGELSTVPVSLLTKASASPP